jgi:hypothetical protein
MPYEISGSVACGVTYRYIVCCVVVVMVVVVMVVVVMVVVVMVVVVIGVDDWTATGFSTADQHQHGTPQGQVMKHGHAINATTV